MAEKVSKEMVVDVPVEEFFDLVTDYERYPDFVPGIKRVKVVHSERGVRDAEYELDLGVKSVKYVLRHVESRPDKVSWTLVKGDMMKVSNGSWELSHHAG